MPRDARPSARSSGDTCAAAPAKSVDSGAESKRGGRCSALVCDFSDPGQHR